MYINKYTERNEHFTHLTFESLTDAMDFYNKVRTGEYKFNNSTNQTRAQEHVGDEVHRKNGSDWTGFTSKDHFEQVMRDGDLEKAKGIWDTPSPDVSVQSIRRKGRWGETGDTLDIQKWIMGDFEKCWRSTHRRKAMGGTKNITLTTDIAGNCNVTSNELGWRGFTTLKIADVLSEAGYNVRILGYSFAVDDCNGIDHNSLVTVPIKDFDEGLDITKLASLICRAGFFRTITFAANGACADANEVTLNGGMGRATPLTGDNWRSEYVRKIAFAEEGELYSTPVVKNEEESLKAVKEVLSKFSLEE